MLCQNPECSHACDVHSSWGCEMMQCKCDRMHYCWPSTSQAPSPKQVIQDVMKSMDLDSYIDELERTEGRASPFRLRPALVDDGKRKPKS